MWIVHTGVADPDSNVATSRFRDEELTDGDWVDFNQESGKSNPPGDTAEQLCNAFADIIPADEHEE